MKEFFCDAVVIGAGAAGLCAASVLAKNNCKTIVIDREDQPGGILKQCIHNGFGLRYFKEELTGPEYACRVAAMAIQSGAELMLGTTAVEAKRNSDGSCSFKVFSRDNGVARVTAKAV
ncbi:MAG: NAD(P)-binding protein, partial [Lentisphaeria bacterium]|nr:NAD(P)-binding protein [Lentisphaeria bacterium]